MLITSSLLLKYPTSICLRLSDGKGALQSFRRHPILSSPFFSHAGFLSLFSPFCIKVVTHGRFEEKEGQINVPRYMKDIERHNEMVNKAAKAFLAKIRTQPTVHGKTSSPNQNSPPINSANKTSSEAPHQKPSVSLINQDEYSTKEDPCDQVAPGLHQGPVRDVVNKKVTRRLTGASSILKYTHIEQELEVFSRISEISLNAEWFTGNDSTNMDDMYFERLPQIQTKGRNFREVTHT